MNNKLLGDLLFAVNKDWQKYIEDNRLLLLMLDEITQKLVSSIIITDISFIDNSALTIYAEYKSNKVVCFSRGPELRWNIKIGDISYFFITEEVHFKRLLNEFDWEAYAQ